jgi:4-oxalocrotonate tautomerase
MPIVTIKGIEGVFSDEQKAEVIRKVTDAMVSVEGKTCAPLRGSSSKR